MSDFTKWKIRWFFLKQDVGLDAANTSIGKQSLTQNIGKRKYKASINQYCLYTW